MVGRPARDKSRSLGLGRGYFEEVLACEFKRSFDGLRAYV